MVLNSAMDYSIDIHFKPESQLRLPSQDSHFFLPSDASDAYYRDEIGNISTSHWNQDGDPPTISLRPRFPLFGGWHTEFKFGYNVPTSAYLSSTGGRYTLDFPFLSHWKEQVAVDHTDVKIVLPEGASNIKVTPPFDVTARNEKMLTYLDVQAFGRPVVVLSKDNLIDAHRKNFQVSYDFSSTSLVFEPLLLVGGFLIIFFVFMFFMRLDFKIYGETAVGQAN